MKVILSSTTAGPGGASTVTTEIEVASGVSDEAIEEKTREALNASKVAGETWQTWSKENETPEQKEARELAETRNKQAVEDMRKMLEGQG